MFPSCFLTEQEIFNILFPNIRVFLRKHILFLFPTITELFQKTEMTRVDIICKLKITYLLLIDLLEGLSSSLLTVWTLQQKFELSLEKASCLNQKISLDSRKRIVDAHEAGDGYTKLSQRFQVSRIGPRNSKTD